MKMFLGYSGWTKGAFTFNEAQVADYYDETYISGDGIGGAGGSSVVSDILHLKIGESITEWNPSKGHYSVIRISNDEKLIVVDK